jgi:hypothetical protein
MTSSILRSLRTTLVATTVAITLSTAVATCWAQEQSQNASHRGGAVLKGSERHPVEPDSLNRDPILIAQVGGLWCYTNNGKYPMMVWVQPGSSCSVNVNFWPYVLYGIAGY